MRAAVQVCTGALKLIPAKLRPKDDKVECPGCSLKVKGIWRVYGHKTYIETPNHRPVGVRLTTPSEIDWSTVGDDDDEELY
jgi:hypothetical protein